MKMRLMLGLIYVSASLMTFTARADFKVQCYSGGGSGGGDGKGPDRLHPGFGAGGEPDGGRRPDQVTGSSDGNDNVVPKFENQSVPEGTQKLTKEERKARREARRKARQERWAAMKAKLDQYIQSNSNGLNAESLGSLQTAFEEFNRGPASFSPASVTPSLNYETIVPGGVSGAH
jgi:hypothetical protein